jgi:thymidylate kinase
LQNQTAATSQLVVAVFRAWHEAGIDFLVLRNYEQLPQFTTNDIDVLVQPAQARRAEAVLLDAARASGFRLHNRANFATLALYLSQPQNGVQAHFDLFSALKWRGFDFLDCQEFFARKVDRGMFAVPHPAHEAATNLLASMLHTGQVKDKYKTSIAAGFRAEPNPAEELLTQTYGAALAKFLVSAGAREDWASIEAATGKLRRALVTRQMAGKPFHTVQSLAGDAARLSRRWLRPPGLSVVLCGPDGCGKSTAARALVEGLSGTFSVQKGKHFHWKLPVFSAKRRAERSPASNPHGVPPRNALSSLVYFSFHWLEFVLGSHLRLRPLTFKGGLVLIDRFYYDFFVDQRRYRLQVPDFFVRLGYRCLKQPDLVLLLDAPTEVLQRRKQEVPAAETERQRQAYRQVIQNLPNGVIIDAAQPVEKVADDMRKAILDFMAARTNQRNRHSDPAS